MLFISIILLLIGIVLITISYTKEKINDKEINIEYRYIPRSIYDEQLKNIDLSKPYDKIYLSSNPQNIEEYNDNISDIFNTN